MFEVAVHLDGLELSTTESDNNSTQNDDGHNGRPQRALKITSVVVFVISTLCSLYVVSDFIRNKKRRRVPGKLMFSRTIVNWCFGLVFLIMIQHYDCQNTNKDADRYCPKNSDDDYEDRNFSQPHCKWTGGWFTFFFLVSEAYFCGICWDIYLTLNNPFRKPMADSIQVHFLSWFTVGGLVLVTGNSFGQAFGWRKDIKICWIQNTGERQNPFMWVMLYIPTLMTNLSGIIITVWAFNRLKKRILDDTWELRWAVIKRQLIVVASFSLCYFLGMLCVGPALATSSFNTKSLGWLPFPVLAYVAIQSACDALAWAFIDHDFHLCPSLMASVDEMQPCRPSKPNYGAVASSDKVAPLLKSQPSNQADEEMDDVVKTEQTLSNGLRREVIALMSEGVYTGVRRTAKSTWNQSNMRNGDGLQEWIFKSQSTDLSVFPMGKGENPLDSSISTDGTSKMDRVDDDAETGAPITDPAALESESTCSISDVTRNVDENDTDDESEHTGMIVGSPDPLSVTSAGVSAGDGDIVSPLTNDTFQDSSKLSNASTTNSRHQKSETRQYLMIPEPEPQDVSYPESLKSTRHVQRYDVSVKKSARRNTMNDSYQYQEIDAFEEHPSMLSQVTEDTDLACPFTDYAPHVFRYLRTKVYGISDEQYLESIKPGRNQEQTKQISANFSEGRSGAFFFLTLDKQFIIKTLTKSEAELLLDILPHYVAHLEAEVNKEQSYLNQFLGMHCLRCYTTDIYFVVLGNVFIPDKDPQEKYDLKGSWIARHTNRRVDEGKLMKDEDLHKKLCLDPDEADRMFHQLERDSDFLASQQIMDYSLLLGIYYVKIDPRALQQRDSAREDSEPAAIIPESKSRASQVSAMSNRTRLSTTVADKSSSKMGSIGGRLTLSASPVSPPNNGAAGLSSSSSSSGSSSQKLSVVKSALDTLGVGLDSESADLLASRGDYSSDDDGLRHQPNLTVIEKVSSDEYNALTQGSDRKKTQSKKLSLLPTKLISRSSHELEHRDSLPVSKRPRAQPYDELVQQFEVDDNAHRAAFIEGPGGYYLGVIDMLQKWDWNKRMEHYFKCYVRCMNPKGVSCVEPRYYRRRFLEKMIKHGIKPKNDYRRAYRKDNSRENSSPLVKFLS